MSRPDRSIHSNPFHFTSCWGFSCNRNVTGMFADDTIADCDIIEFNDFQIYGLCGNSTEVDKQERTQKFLKGEFGTDREVPKQL